MRQRAAQVSAVFGPTEGGEDHGARSLAALRALFHALRSFNRTHGRREIFTAGLEAGPLFLGVLREGQRPVCFGTALDRSVRLAEVRHLGIGLVGERLSRALSPETPLDPLIGVSEELGAASLVAPGYLLGGG